MFTDDVGVVLMALVVVVEEVGHSLGQHLMVVGLQTTLQYDPSDPQHQHRMRPLQISEIATLAKVKGKKDKDGCSPVILV